MSDQLKTVPGYTDHDESTADIMGSGMQRKWLVFRSPEAESYAARQRLDEVVERMEHLAAQIQEVRGDAATEKLREVAKEMVETTAELTARVRLPPADAMEVRLVRADVLDPLEESNTTFVVLLALVGISAGGAVGTIAGAATQAGSLPQTGVWWALLTVLTLVTGVFGWMAVVVRRRTSHTKQRLLHGWVESR
jgi:hypothetical protein